jgi:hypothetical protein
MFGIKESSFVAEKGFFVAGGDQRILKKHISSSRADAISVKSIKPWCECKVKRVVPS